MEKIKKEVKVRLIALFFLSNISSLMLAIYMTEVPVQLEEIKTSMIRENYVSMKLRVLVNTSLDTQTPLVLTNRSKTLYIPYVFYIGEQSESNDQMVAFDSLSGQKEIIVSVPNIFVSKLINTSDLLLIPQVEKNLLVAVKNKKGEKYEISF